MAHTKKTDVFIFLFLFLTKKIQILFTVIIKVAVVILLFDCRKKKSKKRVERKVAYDEVNIILHSLLGRLDTKSNNQLTFDINDSI